jgi:hypothetical protein
LYIWYHVSLFVLSLAESPEFHEHFAVIDRQIVWYGSANLLSRPREEDDMIRLLDSEVAEMLLTTVEERRADDFSYSPGTSSDYQRAMPRSPPLATAPFLQYNIRVELSYPPQQPVSLLSP